MQADVFAPPAAIELPEQRRAAFLRKTYAHLFFAILAFIGIDAAILTLVPTDTLLSVVGMVSGGWGWLLVLGAFMAVSWVAERMARSATSLATQYAGLGLGVAAWSVLFVPILLMAAIMGGDGASMGLDIIGTAGGLTAVVFAGLTAFVFFSGVNFGFLRGFLVIGGLAAMGAIGCSLIFGWTLGVWFTAAMVVFASASVLYKTSAILYDYREDQYVSAALGLFASVALLFWYILRLVMSFSRN